MTARSPWASRSLALLGVTLSLAASGCLSLESKRQVILNEVLARRFVDLMELDRTTREEERQFIVESREAWTALREALDLANPVEEGEAAAKFQELRAECPAREPDLAWLWLYFKVWHPDFDLTDRRPLAAVGEEAGHGRR